MAAPADKNQEIEYVIQTLQVRPESLDKLDTKSSSREKDGITIRMPSHSNNCPIQMWEIYVSAAILVLQPPSSVLRAHVKALCEHNDPRHLCICVLKEHAQSGPVADASQEVSMYSFFEEYFNRKFQIQFQKHSLAKYVAETLDDPHSGRNRIPRVYLLSTFVQAFLTNAQFFDQQYEELVDAMRLVNLPVTDVLMEKELEVGEAVDIKWDNVKLYDDPTLILKRYGGWAITKSSRMLTPKDQLVMRLTGCALEQLLSGMDVPDSPRHQAEAAAHGGGATDASKPTKAVKDADDDDDESNLSDFEIDPEHPKIVPCGVSLSEMYLLLRGLQNGEQTTNPKLKKAVVSQKVTQNCRDGHILAAAVLIDLYMREQTDVHHWTLHDGAVAVPYKIERRKGLGKMRHFLDAFSDHIESIFRDMRLPRQLAEEPIWQSLEARGVIDNHRQTRERVGCSWRHVDVWDLVQPDVLIDFRDGYLVSAKVLYDQSFPDPLEEHANDMLMFCYLVQQLFDYSQEAIDGMVRVFKARCPPFVKGELFPPVSMVHAGAVCVGLIDRAFRIANGEDTQLAQEAAEFNEVVMARLEEKFFLSPNIWQSFDVDQSGELSVDEFVEGMRNIDVYKEFRRERVPEKVLHMIVADLAERLFHEVDINMDGTLTPEELQGAFKRRREEAQKGLERRQWFRRNLKSLATQVGFKGANDNQDEGFMAAMRKRDKAAKHSRLKEAWRKREFQSEVDRIELPDEIVDADTSNKH
mmetsp:Transcript_152217/g.276893  ORF Transcript_152217/g.276893 Transcript_152217/m.276893 type:complete len:751 (-) Transcript_152217:60-2312(-)